MAAEGKDRDGRRIFIKRTAAATALTAVFGGVYAGFRDEGPTLDDGEEDLVAVRRSPFTPEGPARIAVARGDDPGALATAALESHGGLSSIIAKGDRVLLKPNIGWDRPARLAANTNPEVVRATARLCLEAGARSVTVADNSCNEPDRCLDRSGIRKALADLPVAVIAPRERDFVEIDLKGTVIRKWPVLRAFLECDRCINLPVAKHHSSAVLTLGMKNWYGILGGGRRRGRLHQKMAAGIVDLASFARPDLTVLDAFRVIFRNGPQGGSAGDVRDVRTVAVSTDPVALDAFGATLFDLEPHAVPYIRLAEERGLGTADFVSLDPIEKEI